MSDLAPFVAAAIRDQVVADLHEENQRLGAALMASMAVTVTGQGGQPVYASADFSTGYAEEDSAFWTIRFEDDNDDDDRDHNNLPLSRLRELEIFVGGILLCEMSHDYVEGFSSLDSNTGTVRFLELEVRKCWITLEIREGSVSDEGLDLLRDASLGMLWRVLSGHIVATSPHACLRVQEVSLDTKYVSGLLARIHAMEPPMDDAQQQQLAQTHP